MGTLYPETPAEPLPNNAEVFAMSGLRLARDEQSLRLDVADKLAAYFGIKSKWVRR